MNPTGKPLMGVQAILQNNVTHAHGVNMMNNNVPQNFGNSPTSTITSRSPVVITTPPSPLVTVKHLPSGGSLLAENSTSTCATGTTPTPTPRSTAITPTLTSKTNTNATTASNKVVDPVGVDPRKNSSGASVFEFCPSTNTGPTAAAQLVSTNSINNAKNIASTTTPTKAESAKTASFIGNCEENSPGISGTKGNGYTTKNSSQQEIIKPLPLTQTTTSASSTSPQIGLNKEHTKTETGRGVATATATPSVCSSQIPITTATSTPTCSGGGAGANLYGNQTHQVINQISCSSTGTGTTISGPSSSSGGVGSEISGKSGSSSRSANISSSGAAVSSCKIVKMEEELDEMNVGGNNTTNGSSNGHGGDGHILIPTKASVSMEYNGMSDSDSESLQNPLPSRPATASGGRGGKLLDGFGDEIGEDVRLVVTLLENSGLCGGTSSMQTGSSRPGTASSRPGTAGSRPGTAGSRPGTAGSRPGTAGSDIPPARPSTAEMASFNMARMGGDSAGVMKVDKPQLFCESRPQHDQLNAESKPNKKIPAPKDKIVADEGTGSGAKAKSPNVNVNLTRPPSGSHGRSSTGTNVGVGASPATVNKDKTPKAEITGSGKVSGEPNLSRSGRMSNPRAASAKVNATTTQTPTSTLGENSKSPRTPRSQSISGNQDLNARPKSALLATGTSRSRPSSTLYQHTASSAQKQFQSPSTTANLNSSGSATRVNSATPKDSSSRPSTRPKTSGANKMGDSTGAAGDAKATLKDQFAVYSRFGDTASDGKHITLSNSDKWMKQAKVVDGKKITTTDTSIYFKKLFKTTKKVPLEDYKKFVEELAKSKKMEPQDILDKLTNCGAPGLSTATKAAHAGVVERLTDTSKYTGSHKERFDATGKGKGIEGRRDVADSSGYVASFKEKLDLNKDSPVKGGSPSPTPVAVKEASPPPTK